MPPTTKKHHQTPKRLEPRQVEMSHMKKMKGQKNNNKPVKHNKKKLENKITKKEIKQDMDKDDDAEEEEEREEEEEEEDK